MKPNRRPIRIIPGIVVLSAVLYGCSSSPTLEETADYSAAKLVQAAQTATDRGEYDLAMGYHRQILERFAQDTERVLWARYEIAFLHHKKGEDPEAIRLFNDLIQSYGDPPDSNLPQGPRILAEKVRENLVEAAPSEPEPDPAPEATAP